MSWKTRRDRPFLRAIFYVAGTVALSVGIWQSILLARLLRHGVRTTGRIAARIGDPTATESRAHPDIEFTDGTGVTVRYNQNGMGSRRVGAPVPVLYDPHAPASTAVVNAFWQLWTPVLLPLWLGLGLTAGALWGDIYSNLDPYLKPQSPTPGSGPEPQRK